MNKPMSADVRKRPLLSPRGEERRTEEIPRDETVGTLPSSLPTTTSFQGGRPPLSAGLIAYNRWLNEMRALVRAMTIEAKRNYHRRKLRELG